MLSSSVNLSTFSFRHELESRDEWDPKTVLYRPHMLEQIIMPDTAQCYAVEAFLRMLDLPFEIEEKANAEHMSPTGKVPFIKCGQFVVAELDPIVEFARNKGFSLTNELKEEEKNEMISYMSLNYVLQNAETYLVWCDEETLPITEKRYGCVYPFPLDYWVTYLKKRSSKSYLKGADYWLNKTLDEVYEEVDKCCNALSARLGESEYFFSKPTELDALIYGHIYTIVTTKLPTDQFASLVRKYDNLIKHCRNIEKEFFNVSRDDSLVCKDR